MLDQDVCIACRRDAGAPAYGTYITETAYTWCCPEDKLPNGVWRLQYKNSDIPKGCRRLFEQLLAAERNNAR